MKRVSPTRASRTTRARAPGGKKGEEEGASRPSSRAKARGCRRRKGSLEGKWKEEIPASLHEDSSLPPPSRLSLSRVSCDGRPPKGGNEDFWLRRAAGRATIPTRETEASRLREVRGERTSSPLSSSHPCSLLFPISRSRSHTKGRGRGWAKSEPTTNL